jgi:serine/threonine-protein kinase
VWVSRSGLVSPVDPAWTGEFGSPALSPDGQRLAVSIQGEASMDVWVKQLDRGPSIRLTFDGSRNDYPTWTPDGASVTFPSNRAGPSFDLWTKRADGSTPAVLELDEEWALAEALWSPDGTWFVHRTSSNEPGAGDILAGRPQRQTAPVPLVATGFTELAPAISPNGRWMAYSSNETGRSEIFVVPFPNAGEAKWPVSVGGGTEPSWSRDSDELFYRNGLGDMVAVGVTLEPTFSAGPTSVLFSATPYLDNAVHRQYDVSPDAQRFVMIRPAGGGIEGQLILVQNFFDEVRARVPN